MDRVARQKYTPCYRGKLFKELQSIIQSRLPIRESSKSDDLKYDTLVCEEQDNTVGYPDMRSGMASGIGLLVMLAFNATEVSCSKNWSLSYKV